MPLNRAAFSKIVSTDTSQSSIVSGGATAVATTGLGAFVGGSLVLPSNVPTPTTATLYNNAGTLTWAGTAVSVGLAPGGTTGDVQFNNAGAFAADTGVFTYTAGSDLLGVNNIASQTGTGLTVTGAAGTALGRAVTITGGASSDTGSTSGAVVIGGGSPTAGTSTTAGGVIVKTGNVRNNSGKLLLTTGTYPDAFANPGTVIEIQPQTPTTSDGVSATVGGDLLFVAMAGQAHNNLAGNATGGAGGQLTMMSGPGGDTIANGNTRLGGAGGLLSLLANDGGDALGSGGTQTGGAGGALVLGSGAGGTGATANGAAGTVTMKVGATTAATVTAAAVFSFHTGMAMTGVITPTQLAASTDNWNPTGLSTANVIRVDSSMAIDLTGLLAQEANRVLVLYNLGGFDITLVHNATSTSTNRFFCPNATNFTLSQKESTWLRYDSSDQRWTVMGTA